MQDVHEYQRILNEIVLGYREGLQAAYFRDIGIDLALIHLAEPFDIPETRFPSRVCSDPGLSSWPGTVDLVAGGKVANIFTGIAGTGGGSRQATRFSTQPGPSFGPIVSWDSLPAAWLKFQYTTDRFTMPGDSGSAVLLPQGDVAQDKDFVRDGRQLLAIHASGTDKEGLATLVYPHCRWIDEMSAKLAFGVTGSFERRRDIEVDAEDGSIGGILENYVDSLSSKGVTLDLTAGGSSATFDIPLNKPPKGIAVGEVGTFDADGSAFVFLDGGRLTAKHLDGLDVPIDCDGPCPVCVAEQRCSRGANCGSQACTVFAGEEDAADVCEASSCEPLVDLLVVNADDPSAQSGQNFNDLVAYTNNGGVVLLRGGADGLSLVKNAQVAVTRINGDAMADVVVVEDREVTVSSSAEGDASAEVADNQVVKLTLPFTPVQTLSAPFTRNDDGAGYDVAFLGEQVGAVYCCKFKATGSLDGACESVPVNSDSPPRQLRTTDVNRDGYADLEVGFEEESAPIEVFLGGPSGLRRGPASRGSLQLTALMGSSC